MDARSYWAERKLMRYYMEDQPYTAGIVKDVLKTGPTSVVEFGCNTGRNLAAIRRVDPTVVLLGIDINAKAVAWGKRTWGLDLHVGDEAMLESMAGLFDVAFTCSVIDHLPDPERALRALTGAAHRLLLVEPWTGTEEALDGEYTWSWDIAGRLRDMGMHVTSRKYPITSTSRNGRHYRMFRAEPLAKKEDEEPEEDVEAAPVDEQVVLTP